MSLSGGRVINGKYRIVRLIGEGGMGSVYEAVHEALAARVAIKVLHRELANTGLGPRFLQEARAAARIQSQHVVRVSDVDKTDDGLPFMVLEYLEGKTLQTLYEDLFREGKRLAYADALDYALQMFEGVEAAHLAGIVHRDLKPDNVMITTTSKGQPLLTLLDFGIAKLEDKSDLRSVRTRAGVVMGTPEYMAPEQAYAAETADVRTDVFSLGVILFEMLAGRRPVGGDDPQQIAVAYLTGEFARLRELVPGIPPEIDAVVHHALAAKPSERLGSVREFRETIEPFAAAVRPPAASKLVARSSLVPKHGTVPMSSMRDFQDAGSMLMPSPARSVPETKADAGLQSTPPPARGGYPAFDEETKKSEGLPYTAGRGSPVSVPVVAPEPPMSAQQWPYGPTSLVPPVPQRTPSKGANPGVIAVIAILALLAVGGGAVAGIYYFTDLLDEVFGVEAPVKKKPRPKPAPKPAPTHKLK